MAREPADSTQAYLTLYFEIEGQLPTAADLKLRNEIGDLLEAREVGEVTGGGGGMGEMDIELLVGNGEIATAAVERLLGTTYPDLKYRVELSEGDEDFEMSDDDFSARRSPAQIVVGILILALAAYGVWYLVDKIF